MIRTKWFWRAKFSFSLASSIDESMQEKKFIDKLKPPSSGQGKATVFSIFDKGLKKA